MFYKNILLQTINEKINSKNNYIISEGVKEMKQKYLKQGIDSAVIDSYLERYKNIKASKYLKDEVQINVQPNDRNNIDKFNDFHDLEVLVDYVENKINLDKQDKTLKKSYRSDNEIETDGEPIYKDSELEVWYADSPRACIKYKGDFPYNWCISADTGTNMYSTYRFKEHEPAFYFIKQLKKIDKELNNNPDFPEKMLDKYHFFVIQVFKNVKMGDLNSKYYYVTSALNDGDIEMSWNDIVEKAPILKSKQEIFKAVPHSETEKADYERFKNGVSDEEFKVLSVEEKRKYLDIYVSQEKLISDEQFLSMPKSLKKLYVGFGVPIMQEQFDYVENNPDLLKYYDIVLKRRLDKFDESMDFKFSNEEVLYVYENQLGSDKFNESYFNVIYYNITATEEEQIYFVKKFVGNIKYIKNPSVKVQIEAITNNINNFNYIKNPSIKVQIEAVIQRRDIFKLISKNIKTFENVQIGLVRYNSNFFTFIIDNGIIPSEKVQLEAVQKDGYIITYIKNPSEKVQLAAVKQTGSTIQYIINKGIIPSEKVQLEAVKQTGSTIQYIINKGITPSEKVQLAAVNQNGLIIQYITNKGITPSEKVQLAAVLDDGEAIFYIKNPSEKFRLYSFISLFEKHKDTIILKYQQDFLKKEKLNTPKVDKLYKYLVKKIENTKK
jgi:hypothetical protein